MKLVVASDERNRLMDEETAKEVLDSFFATEFNEEGLDEVYKLDE